MPPGYQPPSSLHPPVPPDGQPFTECPRVRMVGSFRELAETPFRDGVNALCWPRVLEGDFAEIAARLKCGGGIVRLDAARLRGLAHGPAGRVAVESMLEDRRLLRELGLDPELNGILDYPREAEPGIVRTDVYSFHVDSAPVEADTWLCTYHGASSEGLDNNQAVRLVDLPEIRAALLKEYGGEDDGDFLEYLAENCYDLHYAPLPEARPYAFGQGNLWRIAAEYPGSPVPPCIHRAPDTRPGQPPRMLLIS